MRRHPCLPPWQGRHCKARLQANNLIARTGDPHSGGHAGAAGAPADRQRRARVGTRKARRHADESGEPRRADSLDRYGLTSPEPPYIRAPASMGNGGRQSGYEITRNDFRREKSRS